MIFAGRGISVKRGLLSDSAQVVLVLALLLFCAQSWASCQAVTTGSVFSSGGGSSGEERCRAAMDYFLGSNYTRPYRVCSGFSKSPENATYCNSCYIRASGSEVSGTNLNPACTLTGCYQCSTQAEADSVKCILTPDAPGCDSYKDVPAACEADYQQCVGLGGVWEKVASTSTQCASTCDLCNSGAETKVKNRLNQVCCQQGKAPPDSNARCIPPTIGSNWGMAGSSFVNNDGNVQCGALTTSDGEIIQENADLYKKFCIDGDQYEEQADSNEFGSSSSAESSSSSEEPKSSWQTELEGLEGLYGVLDTIRDTLSRRLTPATEEIRDCLYNFKLCVALEPLQIDWTGMPRDTSMLQIDTAILKHVKPMMDSSVKLDSAQLKVLKQLDSLYKRGLVNDTDIVQAVNAIKGDINDVETAVKGVKHGIDSLIDSMTTYMDKVGQGIGAVGDSVGALRGVVEGLFDTTGIGAAMSAAGSSVDTAGWGAFSDTLSGRYGKLITKASGGAWGDSASLETVFGPTSADSLCNDDSCLDAEADSALRYQQDSAVAMLQRARDSLVADTGKLAAYYDTLSREMQIFNFDSILLAPLREAIPTQNSCPEDCFKGSFRLELIGNAMIPYDYKLCERWSFLGGVDVFVIIRVLLRLITALTCVFMGIWYITGRKI